jgi:hypothetical protein
MQSEYVVADHAAPQAGEIRAATIALSVMEKIGVDQEIVARALPTLPGPRIRIAPRIVVGNADLLVGCKPPSSTTWFCAAASTGVRIEGASMVRRTTNDQRFMV